MTWDKDERWVRRDRVGELPPGVVQVWRLPVGALTAFAERERAVLSDAEIARVQRKHRSEDRAREWVARVGTRWLLTGYLGVAPGSIAFGTEQRGKPVVAGAEGEARVEFNGSHSGDWVLLAFARGLPLGVDVERGRELEGDDLVRGFFAAAEQAAWATIPEARRAEIFFETWTRKEAYLKALGVGLMKPLDSFAVTVGDGVVPAVAWDREDPAVAGRWRVEAVSPGAGYAATVVAAAGARRVETFTFAPESGGRGEAGRV